MTHEHLYKVTDFCLLQEIWENTLVKILAKT